MDSVVYTTCEDRLRSSGAFNEMKLRFGKTSELYIRSRYVLFREIKVYHV